ISRDAGDEPAHRILVEKPYMHVLEVAEDLAAQIEHHFLTRPLHRVGLDELKHKGEEQQPDVQTSDLRNADQRSTAQAVSDERMAIGRLDEIFIDGSIGEEWPEDVGQ